MNITLPTGHQIAVAGSHVVAIGAGAVSALAFAGVLTSNSASDASSDINRIYADLKDLYGAIAGLIGIAAGAYTMIKSGPLASLFRATTTIAASPILTAQVNASPIAQKASVVAVTDHITEVAGIGTTRTQAGQALADAVPSASVQVSGPTAISKKISAIAAILILGSFIFPAPSFAQKRPSINLPIDPLHLNTPNIAGVPLTGNIQKDAEALWNKIKGLTKADLTYAIAKATAANTNGSAVRLQCLEAINDANSQANGDGLKNADGTPMVRPDPAVVTSIEDIAELVDNLSPQGKLFTSCAGAAQMLKTNTLALINGIVTGAVGIAALPAGL